MERSGSITAEGAPAIRVALIEDDRRTRDALRILIDGTPAHRCVDAFGSVEDALRRPPGEAVDVVLLDINLPGMQGSDAVRLVKDAFGGPVVLMLTVYEDEDRIFRSLCNGAMGYILKRTSPARLLEYVREAASGGAPMSPEIAAKVVRLFTRVAPPQNIECHLTEREHDLLQLLAKGFGYQVAAEHLGITINTVRKHVRAIYEKLHVHSKAAAVAMALRGGLV